MTAWGIVGAVSPTLTNWLTPLWLVGVGMLVGLALLLLLWGLALLASRFTRDEASDSPRPVGGRLVGADREASRWFSSRDGPSAKFRKPSAKARCGRC